MKNTKNRAKGLTLKEERYAENVVAGMSGKAAVVAAGYGGTDKSQYTMASKLGKKVEIVAKIAELRKPQTEKALLSRTKKLLFLEELLRTPISQIGPNSLFCEEYTQTVSVEEATKKGGNARTITTTKVKSICRLRALETHARLQGDFAPEKVEMKTDRSRLDEIKARAAKAISALDLRNRQIREGRKAKDDL